MLNPALDQLYRLSRARFSSQKPPSKAPLEEPEKFVLKCAKGARDLGPKESSIRREAIAGIVQVFQRHGGVQIDTPVFELKELLVGKYGEDSKLIYDLADQGGQLLALRYDLTVPFARYLAANGVKKMKRYQVGKVYRRDNPVMTKGRYREFYQCDFDIAGEYDPMLPEAEMLKIVQEILAQQALGDFTIKVNSRKLLDAMVEQAGIPSAKFKTVCSSLDKLDKEPWAEVEKELVSAKGIPKEAAQVLQKLIQFKGPFQSTLQRLTQGQVLAKGGPALGELSLLSQYIKVLGIEKAVTLDLSLARGLDYYTGMIFEAVFIGQNKELGAVAAGGRYDNLVGALSGKDVPSIGGSIGIERIFTALEKKLAASHKANQSEVLVASVGKGMVLHRLRILDYLWRNGVRAEHLMVENPKPQKQLSHAFDELVPMVLWVGEDEAKSGVFSLKVLYKGVEVKGTLEELLPRVKAESRQFAQLSRAGPVAFKKGSA